MIVQLYDRNKSCQKYLFKQHWFPWSTFQDALFSLKESPKFFRFEKFKDNSYFQWHRTLGHIILIDHHEIFSDITFFIGKSSFKTNFIIGIFSKNEFLWVKVSKIFGKNKKTLFQFFYKVPNKWYKQIKVFQTYIMK